MTDTRSRPTATNNICGQMQSQSAGCLHLRPPQLRQLPLRQLLNESNPYKHTQTESVTNLLTRRWLSLFLSRTQGTRYQCSCVYKWPSLKVWLLSECQSMIINPVEILLLQLPILSQCVCVSHSGPTCGMHRCFVRAPQRIRSVVSLMIIISICLAPPLTL